ncbi:MAG: DUF2339 domain-containing protein [Bacteroidota bacterium]
MEFLLKLGLYGIYLIVSVFIALVIYVMRINRKLSSVIHELDKIAPKSVLKNRPTKSKKIKESSVYKLYFKVVLIIKSVRFERYIKEYFIAANIITVLGSLILLVGIGFFVRYSILDVWININGRIVLALIISSALILLAHQFREKQKAFSSIITGTALGILYYIFASAYYNHHLFSTGNAFLITIFLTTFSVLLSFFYDRVSLAMLSVLAAYTAPFLINYDQSQIELLFIYILVLDIGVLTVVFFKKNIFLNLQAFIFTGLYFLIWIYNAEKYYDYANYGSAFFYLTIFYIILFPINTISKIRHSKAFIPFELSSVIVLNTLYYTAGSILLDVLNPDFKGLFTAFVAILNLFFLFILLNIKRTDRGLLFLLIGLSMVFLSLIVPVQFVGKTITIIWSLQMVLLLWVSQKIDIKMFRIFSAVWILVVTGNTIFELYQTYSMISPQAELRNMFVNVDFVSGLMSSIGLLVCIYLVSTEEKIYYLKPVKISLYQAMVGVFAVSIFYLNIYIEIDYNITIFIESELSRKILLGIYNFLFIFLLSIPLIVISNKKAKLIGGVLISLSIVFFFFHYTLIIIQSRDEYLSGGGITLSQFWYHLFISLIIVAMAFSIYLNYRTLLEDHKFWSRFTLWPFIIIVLTILSLELDHVWILSLSENNIATADILEKVHRMPYTILWSGFAALITLIGTAVHSQQLRQVSLFIIFVALLKLFILDIQFMDIENRTISFIGMGGILLFIAFVYQFNISKISKNE